MKKERINRDRGRIKKKNDKRNKEKGKEKEIYKENIPLFTLQ